MGIPTKFLNFLLLCAGFGLGTGSLFLTMTWLYLYKQFSLIANFGTAYSTITLLMIVCEWGGNSLLAREATDAKHSGDHVAQVFSNMVATRFLAAAVIVIVALACWSFRPLFETAFLAIGSLGLLAYAFSPSGLLDVRGRSGFSGVTQSLPVLALAAALPFCVNVAPEVSGIILGSVFTISHCIASAVQIGATQRVWRPQFAMISTSAAYRTARLALPALLMQMPGQILYRVQIYLGAAFFDHPAMALFVYTRQVIGVGYAFLGFSSRVDIGDFAIAARRNDINFVRLAISTFSARLGLVLTVVGVAIAGGLAFHFTQPFAYIALYLPCVLTLAVSSNMQRSFLMRRKEGPMLLVQGATVVATSALMLAGVGTGSIVVLICGEFANHVAQIILLMVIWRRMPPHSDAEPSGRRG